MAKLEGRRKFGKVTWDGRLVVDVNQLYRSRHVQRAMDHLDEKIAPKKGGISDSTVAYNTPLNQ
ncbi:MAG TPA: hypothetical protein VG672_15090 [Bryobacteraceae bacterium]|jgi:hypothetical protein|nr:hypothetical protein [Bryobacteraceae bacterium]